MGETREYDGRRGPPYVIHKSDTRGRVMVAEAPEATVISSSSSSSPAPPPSSSSNPAGSRKNTTTTTGQVVASANQLTLAAAATERSSQLQRQCKHVSSCGSGSQVVESVSEPQNQRRQQQQQLSTPTISSTLNNGRSSPIACAPYSTSTTTANEPQAKHCNNCQQEILATLAHHQIKSNHFGSRGAAAQSPSNSQQEQPANEFRGADNFEQNHQLLLNQPGSNYSSSILFWKFLSNLPRSINQRSKSVNSSTLTPEVAGYLVSKRLCNNEDIIMSSSATQHAAAPLEVVATNTYSQQGAAELEPEAKTIPNKTTMTENRLINIVVPEPQCGTEPTDSRAPGEDHPQHTQVEPTQQGDQKYLGSGQVKLSIATTTTATRSSASSLSSCILSESTSTSEVRLKWGKKMDFLLSIIGFAVDLANIWRFPYLVYKNGGGVFLIPYVTMLIFGGIPLFFLELCLGQFVKKGPITVWNKICPAMKGVGYCSILISWYVSFYYNVLIAWSVYFIYRSLLSFGEKMPWEECDNSWNSNTTCVSISQLKNTCAARNEPLDTCRKSMYTANVTSPASEFFVKELSQIDQSSGLEDMGELRIELVFCLLIVYLLHYFSLFRGLETSGKVVWVTATAPYMILSILLVRGLFLPGASMGIEYYLSPKLERLHDPQVWIDAAGQVFYSIGVGFGVHLTYASFNSHNNNCYRDCLMTSAVNVITSVYSGLVVFVYLGYMATNLGIEIDKVANEGYSLVFEVYPEALTTLPFARFWSILFFIMLLTLGIDSAMGGLEAVITGLEDEFRWSKRLSRGQLTGLVIVSSFLPALISCTQGGAYTLYWFDIYSAGISLLFAALFETIGVVYCYGLKKFIANIESMLGRGPHLFFILCWKYISPLFLGGVIFMQIYTASKITYRNYTYPVWSIVLGWCLAFSSVAAIPIVAICYWYNSKFGKAPPDKALRKRGTSSAASSRHGGSANKKSPNHRSVSRISYSGQNPGGSVTTILTKEPIQQNQYTHHQLAGGGGCDNMSCRTREEML